MLGVKFSDEQKKRLEKIAEVKYVASPESSEEFLTAVSGYEIICSDGSSLLDNLSKLKNVYVTYPFIELGAFDSEELKKNGVVISNTQGSSRNTIAEWVMFMVLSLFRKFIPLVRATDELSFQLYESLVGKKVLIVGKGNIGTRIGELCSAFKMDVDYFLRGEDLKSNASDADIIINSLNCNSSTKNLLNRDFFMSLKKGTYFVSYVRHYTYDIDGLKESIDNGIVAGAGIDTDPEELFDTTNDFYQKVLANKNILVTPHVAFSSKQASANGREFAVENIESFVNGNPIRVLDKS